MSTIRNTITEALRSNGLSSYQREAEPVIAALEAREQAAIDTIRAEGIEAGATEEHVEAILIEAGLVERAVVEAQVADPADQSDLSTVLAAIESLRQEITAIKSAAARHGVRV